MVSTTNDPDRGLGLGDLAAGVLDSTSPKLRVLLVDDFGVWRERVRVILQQRDDLEIVGDASDGLEAVHQARVLKPDVILLDIGLPQMNGFQAASQIKEFLPDAKIIFVTSYNDPEMVRAAMSHGARGYLFKVNLHRELLECIECVRGGEPYISSDLS